MKLLYAARIARFDLLRSINMLARNVTKWTKGDSVSTTSCVTWMPPKSQKLIGGVGNNLRSLKIGIFADTIMRGGQSLRSTSGSHMMAFGTHTDFLCWGVEKTRMRKSFHTWGRNHCCRLCTTDSYNPYHQFMEHWSIKIHKLFSIMTIKAWLRLSVVVKILLCAISIQWMHEIFQNDLIYLVYKITSKMCADVHTKSFQGSYDLGSVHACLSIYFLMRIFRGCSVNHATYWHFHWVRTRI